MTANNFFEMEIKDLFGLAGKGIVFEGRILNGAVSLGDKLEYTEDDGRRISAVVKKIVVKGGETKILGLFSIGTTEIQKATQGQQISVMVTDFFDITKQCSYSPVITRGQGHLYSGMSKTKTLKTFSAEIKKQ